MTEWQKVKLGDLGKIITGKTPSTKMVSYWGNDVPFVTPKDIQISKYIYITEKSLSTEGMLSVKGSVLHENAVCVSCIGNIGYVSITNRTSVSNQQINSIVVNDKNDVCFVYYLIKSLWCFFKNYEGQSTALSILNKTQFSNIDVKIPPLDIQRKIAGILGALDDKIEVLREQNKTLEQMAQAVFQSWFVDFDIVRAKAAGLPAADVCKKYHITPDIYDLFPSAFSADNLPLGWEKKKLGDFLILSYGKALKENERISGSVPVYGSSGQIGTHNNYLVKAPGIVVGRKGTVGSVIWCDYDFYPIDTVFYVQSLFENMYWCFSYFLLKYLKLQNLSGDSAVPGLNREVAYAQIFVCPRNELLQSFEQIANLLFLKVKENSEQIRTLEQTRDTLLPQLISGKIEV